MPLWVPPSAPQVVQTNLAATSAALRLGTTVTASATAHTKGAWASLIDPIDNPSYGVFVRLASVAASAVVTSMLVDIGAGPSGGGSERVIIPDISAWGAGVVGGGSVLMFFPVYVPTGERLSARCQAAVVSDTVVVAVWLLQKPLYPLLVSRWTAYGVVAASSRGTSVAPGTDAFGSWTEIPAATTTSRDHSCWLVTYDGLEDTTLETADHLVQIGYGAAAAEQIIGTWGLHTTASEQIFGLFPNSPIYRPVPSGTQLKARLASGAAGARGIIIYAGN